MEANRRLEGSDARELADAGAATGDPDVIAHYQQWWIAQLGKQIKDELDLAPAQVPGSLVILSSLI